MRYFIRSFLIILIFIPILALTAQDDASPTYEVVEVIDLERISGPGVSSAYLSPDGSRYAHFSGEGICLYTLPDNEEEACYLFDEDERMRPNVETVRWSPDGRYIAFVDNYPFLYLLDSDIRVLDLEEGEIRNLTDDGYERGIALTFDEFDSPIYVDVAIAWSDEGRLGVLRYPIMSEENTKIEEMQIITVDPITGETELIRDWSLPYPFLYYSLAWHGDTIAVGRVPSGSDTGDEIIDLFNGETGEREQVIRLSENLPAVYSMQFSANGEHLLAYNPRFRLDLGVNFQETKLDGVGFITLPEGSPQPLDENWFVLQAGFAPEGTAIAYVVQTLPGEEGSGLYIASAPGEPGELVLPMERPDATTSYSEMQLTWASNNTILIRDNNTYHANLVVLEAND